MKVNSITSSTHHRHRDIMSSVPKRERECVKERENLKQNNYDNINTSIKSNPDARVSFKGVPFIHKAANFASDKPLVAEAIFALLITCGLRPVSIMATASNEEDKDKCAYQAAKSVSSGLVGLAMTAIVGNHIGDATKNADLNNVFKMPDEMKKESEGVIKKGVDALKNFAQTLKKQGSDLEFAEEINKVTEGNKINFDILTKSDENGVKIFKNKIKKAAPDISQTVSDAFREQKVVNNYAKAAKNVADKFFQPVFMPFRAAVTISLIPVLLTSLGLKKPSNKTADAQQNMFNNLNNDAFKDESAKVIFQPFSGVASHENK